jgi:hypothetical protein
VTLSYRRKELSRAKPENIAKVEKLATSAREDVQVEKPASQQTNPAMTTGLRDQKRGALTLALGTEVTQIATEQVFLKNGAAAALPNDVVFTMLGREAPLDFFRRSGMRIAGEGTRGGWIALCSFVAFCFFVYFWKSGGFAERWLDPWPGNMAALLDSLGSWFHTKVADRSTLLGTLVVSRGIPISLSMPVARAYR